MYGQSGSAASGLLIEANGIHGITDSATGFGVVGESASFDGVAVRGIGGSAGVVGTGLDFGVEGLTATGGTAGVHGSHLAFGPGVLGNSFNGTGVHGSSTTATGVVGNSDEGVGVHGGSSSGIGILATGRTALSVDGPAVFSRSGILMVPAGHSSAVQAVARLTSQSMVLATLQQNLDGTWVRSAVPDTHGGKFTVHLNGAAPVHTRVAWFVIN